MIIDSRNQYKMVFLLIFLLCAFLHAAVPSYFDEMLTRIEQSPLKGEDRIFLLDYFKKEKKKYIELEADVSFDAQQEFDKRDRWFRALKEEHDLLVRQYNFAKNIDEAYQKEIAGKTRGQIVDIDESMHIVLLADLVHFFQSRTTSEDLYGVVESLSEDDRALIVRDALSTMPQRLAEKSFIAEKVSGVVAAAVWATRFLSGRLGLGKKIDVAAPAAGTAPPVRLEKPRVVEVKEYTMLLPEQPEPSRASSQDTVGNGKQQDPAGMPIRTTEISDQAPSEMSKPPVRGEEEFESDERRFGRKFVDEEPGVKLPRRIVKKSSGRKRPTTDFAGKEGDIEDFYERPPQKRRKKRKKVEKDVELEETEEIEIVDEDDEEADDEEELKRKKLKKRKKKE